MKSLLFLSLTFVTAIASAAVEVPFDQNDSKPMDQILWDNEEVRAKTVTHNGRNYALMYVAKNQNGQISTQVVGFCSETFKNSIQQCQNERSAELDNTYAAIMQTYAPDCTRVALINHDNKTTAARVNTFHQVYRMRSPETNARDLMPAASSYAFQVEEMNKLFSNRPANINVAEDIRITKQVVDDVSNHRLQPHESVNALYRQIARMKSVYNFLLTESRCTGRQLELCPFNKQTGTALFPQANMEQYNQYNELVKQSLVEMKSCGLADQQMAAQPQTLPQPELPQVTPPVVQEVQPEQKVAEPINPAIQ